MRIVALVGALALATSVGIWSASADEVGTGSETRTVSRVTSVLTDAHIARLKGMLRLSPAQERYWPPVEAALRHFARQQAKEDANAAGFVQRVRDQASAITAQAIGVKRVMAAASPLIKCLDEGQKRDVVTLARALGFDKLAAAL